MTKGKNQRNKEQNKKRIQDLLKGKSEPEKYRTIKELDGWIDEMKKQSEKLYLHPEKIDYSRYLRSSFEIDNKPFSDLSTCNLTIDRDENGELVMRPAEKKKNNKVEFHMKVYKGFDKDKIWISNPANGMGHFFDSEKDEPIFNVHQALKEICEDSYPHLTPDDIRVIQIVNAF